MPTTFMFCKPIHHQILLLNQTKDDGTDSTWSRLRKGEIRDAYNIVVWGPEEKRLVTLARIDEIILL
jgi:hypothetical protein